MVISKKKKYGKVFLFLGLKTNPKSFIYIASSSSEISFYFILFPFLNKAHVAYTQFDKFIMLQDQFHFTCA